MMTNKLDYFEKNKSVSLTKKCANCSDQTESFEI
jgi:hypothetical protein